MAIFMDNVAVFCVTVVSLVVASAVVALVTLLRQKWRLEKGLAAFPTFPDRHWFMGHLHKVRPAVDFTKSCVTYATTNVA